MLASTKNKEDILTGTRDTFKGSGLWEEYEIIQHCVFGLSECLDKLLWYVSYFLFETILESKFE